MIRIVSGGQTGVAQAGWRAARSLGLPTGGWMPRGFETEDGPRPEFAELYGAVELSNARDPDATAWLGDATSPGGKATLRACQALGRPVFLNREGITRPSELTAWIVGRYIEVLNVAGNRESSAAGIGVRAERFLIAGLRRLAG